MSKKKSVSGAADEIMRNHHILHLTNVMMYFSEKVRIDYTENILGPKFYEHRLRTMKLLEQMSDVNTSDDERKRREQEYEGLWIELYELSKNTKSEPTYIEVKYLDSITDEESINTGYFGDEGKSCYQIQLPRIMFQQMKKYRKNGDISSELIVLKRIRNLIAEQLGFLFLYHEELRKYDLSKGTRSLRKDKEKASAAKLFGEELLKEQNKHTYKTYPKVYG
jgi:hypothetical protein